MRHISRNLKRTLVAATLLTVGALSAGAQDSGDPPARVARLNYLNGNVSMEPAGIDDWSPAPINRPFTTGDYLYTDNGAQAELHMDIAVLRMAQQTSFGFLNLDDRTVQLKLSEGIISIRLHNFGTDQVFEVDTPNGAITLLRDGVYRIQVDPNGSSSFAVVRQGEAEITGGGQAFTLAPGRSASLTGTDQMTFDVETAPELDQFDNWCSTRDAHEMRSRSAQYLPPTVIGSEDLDDYGGWQSAPEYGAVWYPRSVPVGWAPYHYGHWAWIEPWGYTWVDDSPWGFAPFHYGRWAFITGRWGWCPGPIAVFRGPGYYGGPRVRPYYAPALVAFFGGAHFGVGISIGGGFGGGAGLAWAPLGFGEVYAPPYHVSQGYFRNVNVSNTTINKTVNVTNVYNNVYVNKTYNNVNQTFVNSRAPGGVSGMSQQAFAAGRPVSQAGFVVPQNQVARLQQTGSTLYGPPVAPTRQSVTPLASARPVARPPAQIASRQVVARTAPPPPAPTFAARQQALQQNITQHMGQPVNLAAVRQQAASASVPPSAHVQVLNPTTLRRTTPVVGRNVPNAVPAQQAPQQPAQRPAQPSLQQQQQQRQPLSQQPAIGEPHGTPPHGTPPNRQTAAPVQPANVRQPAQVQQPAQARRPVQQQPAQERQTVAQPAGERPVQTNTPRVQENAGQRGQQQAEEPRAAQPAPAERTPVQRSPAQYPQMSREPAERQPAQRPQVQPRPAEQQRAAPEQHAAPQHQAEHQAVHSEHKDEGHH